MATQPASPTTCPQGFSGRAGAPYAPGLGPRDLSCKHSEHLTLCSGWDTWQCLFHYLRWCFVLTPCQNNRNRTLFPVDTLDKCFRKVLFGIVHLDCKSHFWPITSIYHPSCLETKAWVARDLAKFASKFCFVFKGCCTHRATVIFSFFYSVKITIALHCMKPYGLDYNFFHVLRKT